MTIDNLRIFSFGGGVQSVSVLALAARGLVHYDAFVFANVGNDSENPATLDYLRSYVLPFAKDHNLKFIEVQKMRGGQPDSVLQAIERDNRSIPIPAYMSGGAPGNRTCTFDSKVHVVDQWIKTQGAESASIGVGISTDEMRRVRSTEAQTHYRKGKPIGFIKTIEYPLIERGLSRAACIREIESVNLPIPPKSSCWFCPFHHPSVWIDMKRDNPTLFAKALHVQAVLDAKRNKTGKGRVYLHSRCQPLEIAVADQMSLFETSCTNQCDSGYCHT